MSKSQEELSQDVCEFFYDYDTYEFNDIYNSMEDAIKDTNEVLSSPFETRQLIYVFDEIGKELKNNSDKQIKDLYERSTRILSDLREYQKKFDKDLEL